MKQIHNKKPLKAWLLAGLLVLQFFAFGIILVMSVIAYRIGEKLLDPIQEDDK